MTLSKSDPDSAEAAARILREGKIAVLPTDTIYGFSAASAIGGKASGLDKEIDRIKKSPRSKPLIELVAKPEDIFLYTEQKIPEHIYGKWPGALTVIVENNASYQTFTGRATSAFRCPGDEWLRKTIALCGCPVYSTSVNLSGGEPMNRAEDILAEFGGKIALFVFADCGASGNALQDKNAAAKIAGQGENILQGQNAAAKSVGQNSNASQDQNAAESGAQGGNILQDQKAALASTVLSLVGGSVRVIRQGAVRVDE